ncbi:MAG: hypothetical protein II126_05810, partial [Erysipelotrichaceae bacterium]|nr:hypothetical protein [Erysipelotrichaceae bacterium]
MPETVKNNVMPDNWYDCLPRQQYSSFIRVDSPDDWFSVYQIRSNIFAIYEDKHFQEVISYLIIGSTKAMLLDSGLGVGDIKSVVDSLYQGEIIVAHTHTHFDHIGGDWQFDEVNVPDHPVAIKRAENGLSKKEVGDNMAAGCCWQPFPRGFDPAS